jgi:hypothetical protein
MQPVEACHARLRTQIIAHLNRAFSTHAGRKEIEVVSSSYDICFLLKNALLLFYLACFCNWLRTATTERWADVQCPFLGNCSINTFPLQQRNGVFIVVEWTTFRTSAVIDLSWARLINKLINSLHSAVTNCVAYISSRTAQKPCFHCYCSIVA